MWAAPAHPCARGISASLHVIAKLAALVLRPRVNLTRFHGVFAPNSKYRVWVTLARWGKGSTKVAEGQDKKPTAQPHVAMSWAQRLKRVFNIDVKTCRVCGAAARVIACIEDPMAERGIGISSPRAHTGYDF